MNDIPLYIAIYKDILANINSGKFSENYPLPAERYMCDNYHVSRSTVRRALEFLRRDGYIFTSHGNGNFVKPQVFEQPLARFYSFTDSLKSDGILIKNTIVNYELFSPDEEMCKVLSCDKNEKFHKLTRLRSARAYPLMIETTYLPKSRFYLLDIEHLRSHSLYEYLRERYNMNVTRGTEVFFPVIPNNKERALLQIPASIPCTVVERFSYEDDMLIEYTKSIVRGDKYHFKVDLAIST
ncbi:MAG: GntR family transcriptional regulator [Oscillospiraceae bacterium]